MIASGSPLNYLQAFFGGVVLSFTPCVYPLIPIIAGYIGIRSGGSHKKGLILSFIYVSGMAFSYSLLGLFAALTGKIFGTLSSHPVTLMIVGLFIVVFGLAMFNGFIFLPSFIKSPDTKKKGNFSVFFLGFSSGFIISPCVSPALFSILTLLFTKKSIIYAMTLLVSFAYGMGLLLMLVGTFSAFLVNLPKSGKWMLYIERFCASIIMGMGIFVFYNGIQRL
ncbi:MAG: sulfite exporter TauE/SafE family protein [Candidatus Omnitrophica bacterium]|nr:sulfite exporter TauE/SafE family protein [Candidatus Omnitrophota bacterium]